jgi:tRNA(Ile)-lysidine synthase
MLLRPLLAERRAVLRDWLSDLGVRWIDDPANADPRFGRSRARLALAGSLPGEPNEARSATPWSTPQPGVVQVGRDVNAWTLAAALVCAGGGFRPPRGDRLAALLRRLRDGETFTATLAGARLEAKGDDVLIMREAGEMRRRAAQPLRLDPGRPAVWDDRFEFTAAQTGWTVAPALGWMAALEPDDRAVLNRRPAAARAATPVLIRDDGGGPVLANDGVKQRDLVHERLALALDETTHEDDLTRARWRNAVERPIFTDMTFRPAAEIGLSDDRGPL